MMTRQHLENVEHDDAHVTGALMSKETTLRELLGFDIATERERRGWTQAKLAELLGSTRSTVSRWEHGWRVPEPHHLLGLARWFAEDRAA
jgi:DNA-binding transcriptional regulator YiaG